jgi:hypothetical protein
MGENIKEQGIEAFLGHTRGKGSRGGCPECGGAILSYAITGCAWAAVLDMPRHNKKCRRGEEKPEA